MTVIVKFKKLRPDAILPAYKTEGAVGADLTILVDEQVLLYVGETQMFSTGLTCEIPPGWELQVRPRSSLHKMNFLIPNSPGTIDSDYRGEIKVLLMHTDPNCAVNLQAGSYRVAQLVLKKAPQMKIFEVDTLSDTARGEGGFGSTND